MFGIRLSRTLAVATVMSSLIACGIPNSQLTENADGMSICQVTSAELNAVIVDIKAKVETNESYLKFKADAVAAMELPSYELVVAPTNWSMRCSVDKAAILTLDFIVIATATSKVGSKMQWVNRVGVENGKEAIGFHNATMKMSEFRDESKGAKFDPSAENIKNIFFTDGRIAKREAWVKEFYGASSKFTDVEILALNANSDAEQTFLVARRATALDQETQKQEILALCELKLITLKSDGAIVIANVDIEDVVAESDLNKVEVPSSN